MATQASNPATRSRAIFFAVLVFEVVFLMAARTPVDSDLWWHLAAGEQTLQAGWPVLTDTFSFTRAGAPWTNHSWLGEVALALVHRAGGWFGLSALMGLLAASSLLLVYRQMEGPAVWRAFLIVLVALVCAPVWTTRPHLFSLWMVAVVNGIVLRFRRTGHASLYWLPILFILWSNLHGGYPLGLILLGCTVAGALVDHGLRRENALPPRAILQLGMWSLACIPAVLVNPNGIAMWRIPFETVGVSALQQAIPEWASPDFHAAFQQPFLLLLTGLIVAFGLSGRPVGGDDLLKVIVFAAMGLVARRNFGPFALVSGPVLAAVGWQVIERLTAGPGLPALLRSGSTGGVLRPGVQRLMNALIVVPLAVAGIAKLYSASSPQLINEFTAENYPVGAVEWLKANRLPGNLFNEYAWGGYLIWSLPEYPVYVDGRTDLFGDEVIGEWLQVINAQPGWQQVLERRQVRTLLIRPDPWLMGKLEEAGWVEKYGDATAVIFSR